MTEQSKNTDSENAKNNKDTKLPDIGWKPHVRCREKGKAFGITWTYKDGVIDKAKCQGCGKLFDIDNDEDHTPIVID